MPEPIVNEFHVAPVWLTHDYVEQKLRVYFKDAKLQLMELQVTPGTANGKNYASVMTRINVEFKDKDLANQRATRIQLRIYSLRHLCARNGYVPGGAFQVGCKSN
ncbi:uncharacterized protein LOC133836587 [Drosophila sulfurigaster albostrigata]|uniref:uncharacterized protein LOC133836587 n=1 Tax=Drosophila sulfurigaster albostrigata TaxID=89887 RepID=UPI002D218A06|nr:uncharacterized protein LOC133836587 [Drosophila sulfurigaster albostrigata]XP_062123149.1 uncharacterized protein LOC133836587 [Drosophila sulfurigaster albostrigata]XP_062123150.1 uncharacterized protein LOC133836587 [Drosophila sulfurigaster albostrigata]XP_062123151.1 uncharacterized protein LOC133836587 [Drosophila sulfurigaster albostrigata]